MADDEVYADHGEEDEEEEDWFGEGTAFDSGEDLAAALFSMAGLSPGDDTAAAADSDDVEDVYDIGGAAAPSTGAATIQLGAEAFQIIERAPLSGPSPTSPIPSSAQWSVRPQVPGTARTGWGMRHSVQFLKTTEEVITRLRNEAIELTWQAAAVAVEQSRQRRR